MTDEPDSPALAALRKVNVLLAPLLVELYGEKVRPAQATDPHAAVLETSVLHFVGANIPHHNRAPAVLLGDFAQLRIESLFAIVCFGFTGGRPKPGNLRQTAFVIFRHGNRLYHLLR